MNWLMRHQNIYSKKKKTQKLKQTVSPHLQGFVLTVWVWCWDTQGWVCTSCSTTGLYSHLRPCFYISRPSYPKLLFSHYSFWTVELWGEGELVTNQLHSIYPEYPKPQEKNISMHTCVRACLCVWSHHLDHLKKALLLTLPIALTHSK